MGVEQNQWNKVVQSWLIATEKVKRLKWTCFWRLWLRGQLTTFRTGLDRQIISLGDDDDSSGGYFGVWLIFHAVHVAQNYVNVGTITSYKVSGKTAAEFVSGLRRIANLRKISPRQRRVATILRGPAWWHESQPHRLLLWREDPGRALPETDLTHAMMQQGSVGCARMPKNNQSCCPTRIGRAKHRSFEDKAMRIPRSTCWRISRKPPRMQRVGISMLQMWETRAWEGGGRVRRFTDQFWRDPKFSEIKKLWN